MDVKAMLFGIFLIVLGIWCGLCTNGPVIWIFWYLSFPCVLCGIPCVLCGMFCRWDKKSEKKDAGDEKEE